MRSHVEVSVSKQVFRSIGDSSFVSHSTSAVLGFIMELLLARNATGPSHGTTDSSAHVYIK